MTAASAPGSSTPVLTATQRKLALSSPSTYLSPSASSSSFSSDLPSLALSECIAGREKTGYRLLKLDAVESGLGVCSNCHSPLVLEEKFDSRKGLVTHKSFSCPNRTCKKSVLVSDPYSPEATALNNASILGTRMAGCGLHALDVITACMGMVPPFTRAMWTKHNKDISVKACEVARNSCVAAAEHLHRVMGKPLEEVIDVIVTVDGTWQKRGRTSLFGIVVVIAWKTGQVLAWEVLSKHCTACKLREDMDVDSEEYKEWYEGHKKKCECNYKGSSNGMEIAGVKAIWLRSIEDLKLRYTTFIGDGDSKTFASLTELKPYGNDVEIIKHECVGHVQKRMGTALRNLKKSGVQDENGKLVKFKGRLTNDSISALNVYYGGAIRNNKDDIDGMIKAIDASFLHSMSTDEHPMHMKCPEHKPPDKISWCRFKVAAYEKKTPEPHKPLIPRDLAKYVRPVYMRLANRDLLERCTLGATQNQNESFNNVIWLRASKTQFLGLPTVELAASIGVLDFNEGKGVGMRKLFEHLGLEFTARALAFFKLEDQQRLYKSQKRASEVQKRRRKRKARERVAAEEAAIAEEGPTYGAGEF